METKKELPDSYFEDQEFLLEEENEQEITGILGKNPSADQLLKYELCIYIENLINSRGLSLSEVQRLTRVNASDISRIKNHHLERFTIDKLIKISALLDSHYALGEVLASAGEKISKISA